MTEDATVTIAEIRTLVGERQRFEEWLSALDSRKGETPARVFERVRGDYVQRRDAVIASLHEHVGTLESMERDLTARLHGLETQLAEREDERAEAMLRTAVGEFDSDRWENTRVDVEASLAQLNQQREGLLAEADDTRALLASARHRPATPQANVEAVSAPVANAVPASDTGSAAAQRSQSSSQSRESSGADIEAAFAMNDEETRDVINAPADAHKSEPVGEVSANAKLADEQTEAEVDTAMSLLDSKPGSTVPESFDDIDVFGEPGVTPRASNIAENTGKNGDARTPWAAEPASNGTATRDAFDDLAFLRSVTETGVSAAATPATRQGANADQTKTLRCTECGTMNFPTEWYCERCGGELAAF